MKAGLTDMREPRAGLAGCGVRVGDKMDVPERAEGIPESISIGRCRELLGDDADGLTDDKVIDIARHAEAMAHILIDLAVQDRRIH